MQPTRRRRRPALRLAAILCALPLAACHVPPPIEANVEFETGRGIVRGVSTEDGLLALREIVPESGELSFRYRRGNGLFDDRALLLRASDVLALLDPVTSRPNQARFAVYPAARDDRLFIEARTGDHADLLACRMLDEGRLGDFVVLDEGELHDVARRYAGAGLFAWREGTLQLVGVLNGVYCEDPAALAFIGLDEMSTLLPVTSNFFQRRAQPLRADFEYGIPRDFEGERPHVADPPPAEEPSAAVSDPPRDGT